LYAQYHDGCTHFPYNVTNCWVFMFRDTFVGFWNEGYGYDKIYERNYLKFVYYSMQRTTLNVCVAARAAEMYDFARV